MRLNFSRKVRREASARYGRLTTLYVIQQKPKKWLCYCDCGNTAEVFDGNLKRGHTTSCGCLRSQDAQSHKPEYRHWINMKSRCLNPRTPGFHHYGGRGILVCAEWRKDFAAFLADVGPRPSAHHSLDRIDNNGNYEPGNVRWATPSTQMRNVRRNRLVKVDGRLITLAEAAERAPVPYNTVLYRLRRGWSVENAVSMPAKKGFHP